MKNKNDRAKPNSKIIEIGQIEERGQVLPIIPWKSYSFAPEWYADAIAEADKDEDHNSVRREIIFAVCCAESYLFEWVRDEVLHLKFDDLPTYFPYKDRRGIRDRWKEVIHQLHKNGFVPEVPDFNTSYWTEFIDLIDFRDGLVHGKSSRPDTGSLAKNEKPLPSKSDLDKLDSGWATRVITNLIKMLHLAAGTDHPKWLINV